ncbi:hypothetical protein [Marinicrinis lubricantis]|uniref:Uncharacterized protein n=1 Tax=Marinicrinis lubricantis TaxID=2086470 RepID=A0ABW1IJS2_9BACL
MLKINFQLEEDYCLKIQSDALGALYISSPVEVFYLSGRHQKWQYDELQKVSDRKWEARCSWIEAGYVFRLTDHWEEDEEGRVSLFRRMRTERSEASAPEGMEGIQLRLNLIHPSVADQSWRFSAPAAFYSTEEQRMETGVVRVYMDDRLAYPQIVGYQPNTKAAVSLSRIQLADFAEVPRRKGKENQYLQATNIGSIGYERQEDYVSFQAYLPYFEGEQSVALDASLTPVSAFYPLEGDSFELTAAYQLHVYRKDHFSEAVYASFKEMAKQQPPQPVSLPFTLEQSIEYRSESLKRSYRELQSGAAGFFFHFDPRYGYESAPSGFGTSFNNIPHDTYTSILEYGFTGRQVNAAYILAKREGAEWLDKGKKVIDFFVDRCVLPSGWMYTLYDLKKDEPFYSFGDPEAPKLHYISQGDVRGNYLRLMVEPAFDLLLSVQLYRQHDRLELDWMEAVRRFADFLLRHQNPDGSWYRAYEPDGTPLMNAAGFGHDDFTAKSASAIPMMFLLSLWQEYPEQGAAYLEAATRAANFVLKTYVEKDHYQGGTLDNPNVIDKEAAQYTTAALYTLYKHTGEEKYLRGSERAAQIFVTWNYIWNAPLLPGTDLHRHGFQTVGNGGINSIWGGGVVDIYSLFFIRELHELGAAVGDSFYEEMAAWIAVGTQQVLSHPGDMMGFADIGMQPEGFGVCNQGLDEGMIAKGDIWGTLGWIYSAGIHGLGLYLEQLGTSR